MSKRCLVWVFSFIFMAIPLCSYAGQMNRDGEIAGWLKTLDKTEMSAAQLALNRTRNPIVDSYASYLYRQHSSHLVATRNLVQSTGIKPNMSAKSVVALSTDSNKMSMKLKPLYGKAFQIPYVNGMIKGHQMGIAQVNKFMTVVQNPKLKKFLKVTLVALHNHLAKGEQAKSRLINSGMVH